MAKVKFAQSLKYILTLTIICLLTASLLSLVYQLTRPKIEQQKNQAQGQALKEVLPQAGYFEPVIRNGRTDYFRAYPSEKKDRLLGYAFIAEAKGYSSVIETMAGMDRQGKISGIKVLAQNETPGLGAKINEVLVQKTLWQAIKELFSRKQKTADLKAGPWFCAQFKGKQISDLAVVKTESNKNIQAITGATISSQALTDSIRERAEQILADER